MSCSLDLNIHKIRSWKVSYSELFCFIFVLFCYFFIFQVFLRYLSLFFCCVDSTPLAFNFWLLEMWFKISFLCDRILKQFYGKQINFSVIVPFHFVSTICYSCITISCLQIWASYAVILVNLLHLDLQIS